MQDATHARMIEYERDEMATTEEDEGDEEVLSPDSTSRGSFGELEEVPGELDEARRAALEQVEIRSEANFDHDAENSHGHGLDLVQDLRDGDLRRLSSRPGHGALDYNNDVDGMDDDEYDDDDEEGEEVHQQQQYQHEDENEEEDEEEEETLGSDEHEVDTDEGEDQRRSPRLTIDLQQSETSDCNAANAITAESASASGIAPEQSRRRSWSAASYLRSKMPSTPLRGRKKDDATERARASSIESSASNMASPSSAASHRLPRTPLSAFRKRVINKTPSNDAAAAAQPSVRRRTFSASSFGSLLSSPMSALRGRKTPQSATPRSDATGGFRESPQRRRRFWSNASTESDHEANQAHDEEKRSSKESKMGRFRAAFKSSKARISKFGRRASQESLASRDDASDREGKTASPREEVAAASPRSLISESDNEIEYGPKDDPHGDSRSETSSQRTVEVPYEEEIRVCLLSFYIEHNPEKIGDVPMLLEKYAGDEEQMLLKLEEKYDADVLAYEDALEVVQDYEEREGVRLLEVDDATSEKDHQSRPPSPLREPESAPSHAQSPRSPRLPRRPGSPPLPQRPGSPPLPHRPGSPEAAAKGKSSKREFAEPFGTIERIWLTTKPELLLGISYHEHARAILLQLNESFMRQESVESVLQTLRRAHKYYLHGADEALEEGIRELKDVLQSHDRREDRADAAPEDDNGEDEVAAESPQPHHEEDQRLEAASEASSTLDAERESASDESSVEDTATGVGALIRKNEAAISAVQEQEAVDAPDWMWEGREFDDDGDDNGNDDGSKRPQGTEEDQDDDRSESMSEGSWDRDTEASAPENPSHQQEASPETALSVLEKEDEMLMSPLSPSTGEETSDFGDGGGGGDDDDNENVSRNDGENTPVAPPVPSRTQFDALDTAGLSYRDRVDAESVRQWKKRLRLMDNALFEIIDTERQYFNHLDTINDLVIGPMLEQVQKRKIRFTQKGADALLGLLRLWPKLTKFHGNLNERLWRRCVDENARQHGVPLRVCWDESSQPLFGCLDELASLRSSCFMYEDYCSQYAAAVANYAKELQVNKHLGTFLRANCEGALRGGSLENFLIMPVQRICKYPLLLQAVASHQAQFTPLQREACEKINRAIRDTASWVEQIDVSTSKTFMYEAMANITRRLRFGEDEDSVSLTEPHRALLKAETLAILRDDSGDRANAAQGEMRFVILYNDVLLLTVARKSWLNPAIKVYDVMQVLPLREAVCVSIAGIGGTGVEPLRLESDAWRLTQTLDLLFETSAQADAWKAGVENALAFANNEVNAHRDGSLLSQLAQRINSKRNQSTFMRQLLEKPSRVSRAFGHLHQAGAITIQRTFRGLCGRRRAKARKDELSREVWAAMTIQRAFKRMRKKLYWSKQRRLEGEREARVSYEELRKAAEDDSSSGGEDEYEDDDDAKNENALEEDDPYSDWDDTASEAEAAPPRASTVDGGDSLDDFGAFDEAVGLRFDDDDDDDDDVQRV